MATLQLNMTREAFLKRLRDLPGTLTGRVPDNTGIVPAIVMAGALAMLARLYHHAETLTRGGTGDDGTVLQPLAPSTLMLRRQVTTKGALRRMVSEIKKQGPTRRRLFLTQLKRARSLFTDERQRKVALHILERMRQPFGNTTPKPAMTDARYIKLKKLLESRPPKMKKHWAMNDPDDQRRLKAYQRKLNLVTFAAAGALILIDTGRLLGAFSPAYDGPDQEREVKPGGFKLDNNVEYFKYHQSDAPRKISKSTGKPRLPRRNLIPDIIPHSWIEDARDAMAEVLGMPETIKRFFQGAA